MLKSTGLKGLTEYIKENKSTFAVYVVLRLIVIAILVIQIVKGNFQSAFICALSLVLFLVPAFFERTFRLELPSLLEIIILLFIFSAEILGEIGAYYVKVPHWDTMLHTVNGFLCAAIGFALVDILNRNERIKFTLSPLFVSIVAFCFSMTIGVLWEFFEFGSDMLLKTDMQKDTVINSLASIAFDPTKTNKTIRMEDIQNITINGRLYELGGYVDIGLIDTMKDLIVNFFGAVVFSVIGFFYIKNRGKGKFAKKFIPKVREAEL
ncbi:MAG: hypothetical protein J6Q67_08600 [Clostridia bacterium]|nr:hypothetical protein [Clostridia bacterium]